MRNYRPIPPPPPPETEPFIPQDPDVGEQSVFVVNATLTSENPKGTVLTYPITGSQFFVKITFAHAGPNPPPGTAYMALVTESATVPKTLNADQQVRLSLSSASPTLSLVNTNVSPESIQSSRTTFAGPYFSEWYIPVALAGFGTGTLTLPNVIGSSSVFTFNVNVPGVTVTAAGAAITVNLPRRPVVTLGAAQNPVGTFLDAEINHSSFFVDFTWDLPTSASFTAADITATSSNTSMTVTKGSLENTGTVGTSTHYRMEFTVTGTGITSILVTVPAGAVPAAGANGASEVRTRTYEVNTYPAPVPTFGSAQDSDGNALVDPITATTFYVPITWDRDIGTAFTEADLNIASNNANLRANIGGLTVTTPGRVFTAEINLSGGDSGVLTLYTNRGAIPATASTSSSIVHRSTYNASLPPPPPPEGTQSGPSITQSGGSVLLRPDVITQVDPPILDIISSNLEEARQPSNTPVNVAVSFVFDRPVNGFGQATPNYRFIPRAVDATDPRKDPQLGTFSGVDGNATYEQIIEIQPDSAGKINVFVAPNTAVLVSDSDVYGPEPTGEMHEIFYDTTVAGNPAPNVNISTPPTTFFTGATFTTTFTWDQPIERNTFRTSQVFVSGAGKGPLTPDPERRDIFTMQLTLPDAGVGEVTISVFASRIVSTAATGIVSRREGPEVTVSETFQYDRGYSSAGKVVQGASTICEVVQPIATNTFLDGAVTPSRYGGAFAGVSDMVYVEDPVARMPYLYCIVQQIKRRRSTTNDLANQTEAGAFLMEVNLTTNVCRVIKRWAFITIAARSLEVHDGEVYWFEGSHYGNRRRQAIVNDTPDADGSLPVHYPETMGNVFSVKPGTRDITDHGINWRSQFDYPADDVVVPDYGFHTQTASPMRSDGDNLYLISGFGGLQGITSTQYATSRRGPVGVDVVTDIGNWQLLKYSEDLDRRIWLFNGNGMKGWEAIRVLASLTQSFIGIDRHGLFYFTSKGGVHAEVQSSAPGSIEFRNPTDIFPQQGLIEINNEIIGYSGIIGRQFLNIARAQYGTSSASHATGSVIRVIKTVLNTSQSVFDPIDESDIRSNTSQLFNKIVVSYDNENEYEYQDDASILRYGERIYEMTLPLNELQTAWIEDVARRFIDAHKDVHHLITLRMHEDFDIEVTDVVFLQIPERSQFNHACQVYQVTQNPTNRETELILRTL